MFRDHHLLLRNQLWAALPTEEFQHLSTFVEPVALELRQILQEPNERISFVYFPINGVVSLLTVMQNRATTDVAMLGKEGMVGLPAFLGGDRSLDRAIVQIPGAALRMPIGVFRQEVTPNTTLYRSLQVYAQILLNQVAQIASCNQQHSIQERCCRSLLMSQDRMGANQFPLTQEFLARMVGVRRAGVSEAASAIQKMGLIQYSRGKITILNQEGLKAAACECYISLQRVGDRLLNTKVD